MPNHGEYRRMTDTSERVDSPMRPQAEGRGPRGLAGRGKDTVARLMGWAVGKLAKTGRRVMRL